MTCLQQQGRRLLPDHSWRVQTLHIRSWWSARGMRRAITGKCAPSSSPPPACTRSVFDPKFKKNEFDPEARESRLWACRSQEHQWRPAVTRLAPSPKGVQAFRSSRRLFDLTTLQREANSRFGFSAKNTLGLAQALYEKHKVLATRVPTRALPEDYMDTVKQTMDILAELAQPAACQESAGERLESSRTRRSLRQLARSAITSLSSRRCRPRRTSGAEQKLYDLAVRRFLAVFFPAAEFQVTTRITSSHGRRFKTSRARSSLVSPGRAGGWCSAAKPRAATPGRWRSPAGQRQGRQGRQLWP
ncbi:DNA topoisomerase [Cupriavidus basilensis]